MKILYLEWNSYCNEDMKEAFRQEGHDVECCSFEDGVRIKQELADKILQPLLKRNSYDFVFSFNYVPVVSNICKEYDVPYVSWVYDSPYVHVYSYTVLNSCNYIFLFDYAVYQELHEMGIQTVYYLPLAANPRKILRLDNTENMQKKFCADVSFVGSLYDEAKHRLYDRFLGVEPYVKGYLDAIIEAQKRVYGCYFLNELLNDDILKELQKVYPTNPNPSTVMNPRDMYADYVLARRVTALERKEILALLGAHFGGSELRLYTNDEKVEIPGIKNCGPADYNTDVPYIFKNSKINLNITLRSIKTGIPLRIFDIMGSGGFLLTNYQEELMHYFEPNVDFVYYENYEDLIAKTEYYLSHEKERREIAENGYHSVCERHNIIGRVRKIVEVVANGQQNN